MYVYDISVINTNFLPREPQTLALRLSRNQKNVFAKDCCVGGQKEQGSQQSTRTTTTTTATTIPAEK